MDTISRKALIDWAIAEQSEIHLFLLSEDDDDDRSYLQTKFAMFQKFRDKVESIPSTESEGEATVTRAFFDVQMDELRRTKQDNERLRAALQEIEDAKGLYSGITCRVIARKALVGSTSETAEAPCRNCEGSEKHVRHPNGDGECLNCGHIEALSTTSETAVQPQVWIDGAPPDFTGQDRVLVVVELPSLFFGVNVVGYMCSQWLGESWSRNEVYRASRWMQIPLPPGIKDGREEACKQSD